MKKYSQWLIRRCQLKPPTVRQHVRYTHQFLAWLAAEALPPESVGYADLLAYIRYLKKTDGIRLINRKLGAIRKYYEYLKSRNQTPVNPATGLYLRGTRRTVPHTILSSERLDDLYHHYESTTLRRQRNKVMLGLLVYQALTTGELHKLEASHINLHQGKITIPGTSSSNSRALNLQPFQILELQTYIEVTRPQLIKSLTKNPSKPMRKPKEIHYEKLAHQLFISESGSENLKPSLLHLFNELKQANEQIKNASQIRQSVLTHWLKTQDLRTVQYKAGHKYVSSTERYQTHQLEELQQQINLHHPLDQE